MSQINPYAPPLAPVEPRVEADAATPGLWRDGTMVVVERNAAFPARCVKCNAPVHASQMHERTFYWHTPALYLLALLNLLIYAIVALAVRKRVTCRVGLCERHLRWRRMFIAVGWSWVLSPVILYFVPDMPEAGIVLLVSVVLIFIGIAESRVMVARGIDDRTLRFSSCGKAFVDALPPISARNASPPIR